MENFQLYRTNILLGGQMKWDLILDSNNTNLTVTDVHLSPINIKSPKYPEENLLNYSHQENIKKYYKMHESDFYNTNIDARLSHNQLVISDIKNEIYEDSFEAGCSNGSYQLYNKPIEIFCPIWLEHLNGELEFEITMYSITDKKISSKVVKFENKFKTYFENYINYLGIDKGIDDVLNINFNTKQAIITGINLQSGNIVKQDVSYLVPNLLYRERPMLEFDSMLINIFSNNKIAVRQLFNFNFCLDINDMISGHLAKMVYGNKFKFKVIAKIDGKPLEMRDFYSNYSFIEKEDISIKPITELSTKSESYNVLDYLYDYNYVNYIDKNKYIQSVIHWSLNDNPNYLFNLYNGFGPYDNENFYSHKYGQTPDLLNPIYNSYSNNIGWCAYSSINNFNNWLEFTQSENELYEDVKKHSSDFKSNWINNIKYEYNIDTVWEELKFMIFLINDDVFNDIANHITSGAFEYIDLNNGSDTPIYIVRIKKTDGVYGIVVKQSNIDNVTYVGINNILNEHDGHGSKGMNEIIDILKNKLASAKSVPLISINKSLYIINSASPSVSSTEIDYYKDDDISTEECYVLRYDGKIKPTFLNKEESLEKNIRYFKETLNEEEFKISNFNKYSTSKFPPIYPSIGYCAVCSGEMKYDKLENSLYIVIPEIAVDLYSIKKNGKNIPIESVIKLYIKNIYDINNDDVVDLIYNMYNIEYSYDYKELDNLNDYIYHVKMILK